MTPAQQLILDSVSKSHTGEGSRIAQPRARAEITIEQTGRYSYRAKAGARVVGKAVAWQNSSGRFVIQNVAVSKMFRRRGIATKLYQQIESDSGVKLSPADSLSDDGFEFWKHYRAEEVASDLRHRRAALLGAKVVKGGRTATITDVGARGVTARYDGTSGANSETFITSSHLGEAIASHSTQPRTRVSSVFRSELLIQVENSTMKLAPVGAWKSFIKALTQKGVKAEEIEWTGVNDWLVQQTGKVSRDELLSYLYANELRVKEVVLSGTKEFEWNAAATAVNLAIARHKPDVEIDALRDIRDKLRDALSETGETKFSQYQLPGGTNYREVLLTLPSRSEPIARDRLMSEFRKKYGEAFIPQLTEEELKEWHSAYKNTTRDRATSLDYKSTHWAQANVLAHIRINDRVDADGNKVLFIEELQSDWAADKRKGGFRSARATPSEQSELQARYDAVCKKMAANPSNSKLRDASLDEMTKINRRLTSLRQLEKAIPPAPFVGSTSSWVSLALKHVLKIAVDGSYAKVAIITGEQSAARYDLSEQVDAINYTTNKSGSIDYQVHAKNGKDVRSEEDVPLARIEETLGKGIAELMASQSGHALDDRFFYGRCISGLDLKIGGEGMLAFYNQIVPNILKDVLRKYGGGEIEATSISGLPNRFHVEKEGLGKASWFVVRADGTELLDSDGSVRWFDSRKQANQAGTEDIATLGGLQNGFKITEAMRAKLIDPMPEICDEDNGMAETEKSYRPRMRA